MSLNEDFPRSTVFWILITQIAAFVPHISNVPIWLSILYAACLIWRFGVYQGRWDFPSTVLKLFLILSAFIGVLISYRTLTGANGGVALLLISFAYKSLEMKERRDAYVTIILGYFVVACAFFHQTDMFAAAYLLFCFGLTTAALISMNHLPKNDMDLDGLKRAFKILLQSIPVMIFLFVFFPKLPPIFQLGLGSDEAKTGLSDTINPGSVSKLTQSAELVFRAKFIGKQPNQNELYWRAQVFENFDGISWKMSDKKQTDLEFSDIFPNNEVLDNAYRYQIYQEPTKQKLLFSLPTAWSNTLGVKLKSDSTLGNNSKIGNLLFYEAISNTSYKRELNLSPLTRARNTSLPIYGNSRSNKYAKELRASVSSNQEYVKKVLLRFRDEEFHYTLEPPRLGANPVDEFLFDHKRGFCEHYASSFVFMMRAADIPARLVGGYQGGEFNKNGEYLLIHQYDAHAWAEVWSEGQGWVRMDPTAFVAPNRINQGINQGLEGGETILSNSLFSTRSSSPLTNLRLQIDFMNLQWDRWVLGYNSEMQENILRNLLGEVNPTRVAIFMIACFFFVVIASALVMYLKDLLVIKDPTDRLYKKMQQRLKPQGLIRERSETPTHFAQRVSESDQELGEKIIKFTKYYTKIKYTQLEALSQQNILLQKEMRKIIASI